ncbi:DNA primase [Alkalitalea saponilacus]|uniref:DNA primase n=1 Tax=Alkalitalea saponilacus TaxID=889453 RepID=A0A1T5EGA9_9BACT|nr:DNA primase [Alkalitalea saponilacus]ASB48991.1 DNA primase [Alkalitalea saponilacus]SKB83053.1 DNA primase [Alkalitalea saponilacus]
MIDKSTIDRVMETAQSQITDVISEFISLKKRGINYIGHCPFHNEKTPSFIVSPHKGIFKCFGCGKGGNAVNFLMEHEQISFVDAIKTLGRKFHIPIEEKESTPEEMVKQNERESMMVVTNFAARWFTKNMFETDEGQSVGLGYFKQRGFDPEIIKKFQLGYSPDNKDAFTRQATIEGYKLNFLEKTGLTVVREDYKADRFRGRVIFPIHSLSGKVIAFGGRILKSDAKAAKYLNSPESEIYHKSKILYGIYFARQEMTRQDRTYLVEGYTDVLSFHQAGITNVVASSGTALTPDQIRLIARFTPNVTIIYDGDPAGIKASLRGIDLILEEGMNVKVLLLPEGEDPDSFAKKMPGDELRKYISENETDFIKFKTSILLEDSKNDPIKRAQLIQDIVKSISVIPDQIIRSVYVKECSTLLQVEESVLYSEIGKIKKKQREKESGRIAYRENMQEAVPQNQPPVITPSAKNPLDAEEKEIMRFLLKYGHLDLGEVDMGDKKTAMKVGEYIVNELRQDELKSENPVYNLILEEYEEQMKLPGFIANKYFISHSNPDISHLATDLIAREYPLSKIHKKHGAIKSDTDLLSILVPKVVLELKWKLVKLKLEQTRMKLQQSEKQGNMEEVMELIKEMSLLQNVFKLISLQQGERTII